MRRGRDAIGDPDQLGGALARLVPLRGGRNARPMSWGRVVFPPGEGIGRTRPVQGPGRAEAD
jgi:hypothetical protein